jgi:RNA polymerase sigma-70 factor (ECF subfamily)
MMNTEDHSLLHLLKTGQVKAFEIVYDRFSDRLYSYVFQRLKSRDVTEEIVQEIFVSLWNKRESIVITHTMDAYLFGAAKFRILTYIRSQVAYRQYAENFARFAAAKVDNSFAEMMDLEDLRYSIDTNIAQLPRKCQTVFRMSRIDHEPISRIAERMNISKRTVENYLTQALKYLRTSLVNTCRF